MKKNPLIAVVVILTVIAVAMVVVVLYEKTSTMSVPQDKVVDGEIVPQVDTVSATETDVLAQPSTVDVAENVSNNTTDGDGWKTFRIDVARFEVRYPSEFHMNGTLLEGGDLAFTESGRDRSDTRPIINCVELPERIATSNDALTWVEGEPFSFAKRTVVHLKSGDRAYYLFGTLSDADDPRDILSDGVVLERHSWRYLKGTMRCEVTVTVRTDGTYKQKSREIVDLVKSVALTGRFVGQSE